MIWELVFFLLLVVIPVALHIREVPNRIRDLRVGIRGLIYVPVIVVVLFIAAAGAWLLAREITILQWGWLGENIIVAPISDLVPAQSQQVADPGSPVSGGGGGGGGGSASGAGGSGGSTGIGQQLGTTLTLVIFVPIMILALVIFNFYEEAFYRDSLKDVVIWALLHLIMGIPIFAVIPIFTMGLLYKAIRDRKGLRTAYVAHLGTNMTLIVSMVAVILFGPPA